MTQTLAPIRQLALVHPLPDAEFERLRDAVPEVRILRSSPADWGQAVAQADAVVAQQHGVTVDDLLGAGPGLRWIQTASAGVDRHLTARLRASTCSAMLTVCTPLAFVSTTGLARSRAVR